MYPNIKEIKTSNTGDAVNENLDIDWSKNDELKTLAKPIVEFLKKHYDMHCSVVIDEGFAKVVREEIGVPFEIED